jgi:Fe-S cluster assembly protein SufD
MTLSSNQQGGLALFLPPLPAMPEESWRRTDPASFYLPPEEMLDFSGKPVAEALLAPRLPWKIQFEENQQRQWDLLEKNIATLAPLANSSNSFEALKAQASQVVLIEIAQGTVKVAYPAGFDAASLELAAVPNHNAAVATGSLIGAGLASRLRAAVPFVLEVRAARAQGLAVVTQVQSNVAFSQSFSSVNYVVKSQQNMNIMHFDLGSAFAHHRHEIVLEDGAQASETWWHLGQERQDGQNQLLERRVTLNKGTTFSDALVFAPRGHVRVVSNVVSQGYNARYQGSTSVVAGGAGVLDYEPLQEHVSPGGASHLKVKMVASGRARAIFQGLISVKAEAPHSDASQVNKNLVLSKRARVDAQPRLEILPNEVSCKHGSATGELDGKQLYYLTSRGFSQEEAKAMVVRGFALEGLCGLSAEHPFSQMAEDVVGGLVHSLVRT